MKNFNVERNVNGDFEIQDSTSDNCDVLVIVPTTGDEEFDKIAEKRAYKIRAFLENNENNSY